MKEIPLTRGYVALVDDEDHAELNQYKWSPSEVSPGKIYAMRRPRINGKFTTVYMHRVLLGAEKGQQVDHKDGNTLNNTRANIRICDQSQNQCNRSAPPKQNTSGYIGVSWYNRYQKWQASVAWRGRLHFIGYFDDPVEAARARDEKARELHGAFAYLNFEGE